ncbi:MAG: AtpZ/AtpI family protein [Candidatus Saccharicenans sp.]|nr:AtpZ/AtpI family protein [Candidatus Saccharicenans sp.]MDH7493556.1 AtpZ/AtpI family protein [Candidatus Saccharicenans sp.]
MRWLKDTDFKKLAEISSLVMILPSSIAVGLVIGYLLDRWLKTGSWMLLLWLVLGIVSGLLNLFRGIRQYFEKNQASEKPPEGGVDSGRPGG